MRKISVSQDTSFADSGRDHLTGLWNKEEGERLLAACICENRKKETAFLTALLDINDLSIINKACGHQEGDRVLQKTAKKICAYLNAEDFAISNRLSVAVQEGGKPAAVSDFARAGAGK